MTTHTFCECEEFSLVVCFFYTPVIRSEAEFGHSTALHAVVDFLCWLVVARLTETLLNKCTHWPVSENVLYTSKFYVSHILLGVLTRVVPFVTIEITCWDSIKASDLANDFSLDCLCISFFPKYLLVFSRTVPYKVSTVEGKKTQNILSDCCSTSLLWSLWNTW